jgi:hypothetical protein
MPLLKHIISALSLCILGLAQAQDSNLKATYQFLVSDRDSRGGVLYTATAGELKGRKLPLSFADTPEYWGEYVCKQQGVNCAVTDVYNTANFTLTPERGLAGDLQTERVNAHNGANIYDAATWQIAVMLGQVVNKFDGMSIDDAYALASNQNSLLRLGYTGNAADPVVNANRAVTKANQFLYNHHAIDSPAQAYTFRMLPRSWLSSDPFMGTKYVELITAKGLPSNNSEYKPGRISWTDWKPITGENAWAFLLGPLHAAYLYHVKGKRQAFVPFSDLSVQNALAILPTFAAMQSDIGAVYHVPSGTLSNQGDQLTNPYQVSVENNASLYAGLRVLQSTLRAELAGDKDLRTDDKKRISAALASIEIMINGGQAGQGKTTDGLLNFFRIYAWRDGEFVQGGLTNDPDKSIEWIPSYKPKAVDANTWTIAALGAKQIDEWFGFGAAYKNWLQVKSWGAYGVKSKLWGVGFSDQDGNGMNADGSHRQGILSAEWTAGAINMVRSLIKHYESIPRNSAELAKSKSYVQSLKGDEKAMIEAMQSLRIDNYVKTDFPGKPNNFKSLAFPSTKTYLYASRRYLIPFGWYANPIPSTCASAWVMMVADRYDPFGYAGLPNR